MPPENGGHVQTRCQVKSQACTRSLLYRFALSFRLRAIALALRVGLAFASAHLRDLRVLRKPEMSCLSLSAGSKRSPNLSSRLKMVLIVNALGSIGFLNSSHFSGVDTGAPSLGRGEYTEATVLPRIFCK